MTAAKKSSDSSRRSSGHHPIVSDNFTGIFLLPFLATLILFALGALTKSYWAWGFNHLSLLPPLWGISALSLAAILMLPPISSRSGSALHSFLAKNSFEDSQHRRWIAAILVSVTLICLFFFLRSRSLVYGDGFLVLKTVSPDGVLSLEHQNSLQAASLVLLRFIVGVFERVLSISPVISLALFNSLGGVVAFWGIYGIARDLTPDRDRKLFLLTSGLTSGATILFFGYIENYTWALALGLWTFYQSLRAVEGHKNSFSLIAIALLSLAYHAITLPFVIVALGALSLKRSKAKKWFGIFTYRQTVWSFVIGAFLLVALTQATGIFARFGMAHPFVPIWPELSNSYLALSPQHLLDLANLVFLVAPLGISMFVFGIVFRETRTADTDISQQLLGLLVLLTSLASFWIDPQLGMPRDWDLLSFFGIPLSLWAAYRYTKNKAVGISSRNLILPAVAVALVALGPNLYEKTHSNLALERLDSQLWQAPQYQKDYDSARRGLSWGTTLQEQLERDDLAVKYFHRRLEAVPESPSAWFNLGQIYTSRSQFDSAAISFERAVRYNPQDPRYLLKLAAARNNQGRFADALAPISQCERLNPDNPVVQTTYGIALYRLGRVQEALPRFQTAYHLSHGGQEETANLGAAYFGLERHDSAVFYFDRAVALGGRSPRLYESLMIAQLALGRVEAAERTLTRYREINPKAGDLESYRRQLTAPNSQ